jgi:tRNA nucleotidyltransferase (CCA-adding enzyme)
MEAVRKRLSIVGKKITHILKAKGEGENVLKRMAARPSDLSPGQVYHWLHPLPIEVLLFLMTKTSREKTRKAISLYITKLRSVRVSVTGEDLAEMGYPPGPQYREILDKVMDARLDGLVTDRDTEKEWIVRHFPPREGPRESH